VGSSGDQSRENQSDKNKRKKRLGRKQGRNEKRKWKNRKRNRRKKRQWK